jgi:Mat/Ecp fimbriae outer membrane usher protein
MMESLLRHLVGLLALTTSGSVLAGSSNVSFETTGTPPGFEELTGSRVTLVDVYFGGRKVGETLAVTEPGLLRFQSPREVLAKLPDVIPAPEVNAAFTAQLPTNSRAVCSVSNAGDCGVLNPQVVGIMYDDDHFRVDVFVNPRFLRTTHTVPEGYLPTPNAPLSLTNSLGFAVSGAVGGSSTYNLQNQTVVGLRNARIRANTSIASNFGVVVDDFVAELDRKNLRYSAGLFWAAGNDFLGQRRIVGAGVGTQFDTWAAQDSLHGTSVIVFLAQPARVEALVDGRLVSSRSYPAGNIDVDTSSLPDGSYSVLLRIHQLNGSIREERRFFVKNAQVAPIGHPIFYAYAGLLANTRPHHPISLSRTVYYQAGTAWRLTNSFAVDVAAMGTQQKTIVEAGGWLIKGPGRLRAAGLVSSAGDRGGLLQMSTAGQGPLNISLDLRRIWSDDGKPLIPLPSYVENFGSAPATGGQLANGSYTQATGSIGVRVGSGYMSVVGSYRKDRGVRADYSIGPSVNWRVLTRNQLQVGFEASAQRTRSTTAAFAGLRVQFTSGQMSLLSTVGRSFQTERGAAPNSTSRAVSSFTGQYSHELQDRTLLNVEAGVDRNISNSTLHAGGTANTQLGSMRADVIHNFEGRGGTQYDLAFQSSIALGAHAMALGGRDIEQSALLVSVAGDAGNAEFDVLVDEVARGRLKPGQRVALFVRGYRTYKVRLVPTAASTVSYDSAAREVTLYPGNVQSLVWRAEAFFTVFAQATSSNGAAIADAIVQTAHGLAETDANGYFQIDVRREDLITIAKASGSPCHVKLGDIIVKNDFASLGRVICQ